MSFPLQFLFREKLNLLPGRWSRSFIKFSFIGVGDLHNFVGPFGVRVVKIHTGRSRSLLKTLVGSGVRVSLFQVLGVGKLKIGILGLNQEKM